MGGERLEAEEDDEEDNDDPDWSGEQARVIRGLDAVEELLGEAELDPEGEDVEATASTPPGEVCSSSRIPSRMESRVMGPASGIMAM